MTFAAYRTATTPQRSYENIKVSPQAGAIFFGELKSITIGEPDTDAKKGMQLSGAPSSFAVADIDADGTNEIIYLTYSGKPQGPNNAIHQLYLSISSADGEYRRGCLVMSDLVQRTALKVNDVLNNKKAVTITGTVDKWNADVQEYTPFLSIVDPKNCSTLAHKMFNQIDQKTISAFGDSRVYALDISASNGSQNDTISFTVLENKCQYDLLRNRFSFDCTPVGRSAAQKEFTPTYTGVEKNVAQKIEPAFIRKVLHGDLNGDSSEESIFFIRPKTYAEFNQPEKVAIVDAVGNIIGVWETPSQVYTELIADLDSDGKDEVLVRSDYKNKEIEVLGFK